MDQVQAEYGWDDDTVLDMRISRLTQIVAAIRYRHYAKFKNERRVTEWQTRMLSAFIAQTVQDDKGRAQLLKEANKISIDPKYDESGQMVNTAIDNRSFAEIVEHGNTEAALEANSKRKTPMPFT